ncbi:hypothetical protein SLEP1_g32003 [Rubroshorea leprosula]|uniref:Uncharacterized protein n=1 Tax=Rubroshorea leprosula TaxID=152421 RepID=A0AAV5KBY6_9ROSI|nr:hypothetical protein SLEP1_g32003 [Rubroshorea leprosula]
MEGISVKLYKGLKGYWRRKGYVKLNGSRRRRMAEVELGSPTSTRRRRFWRFRVKPKLKFKLPSGMKFFLWLREAYVNMMLKFAHSTAFASSGYCEAISDRMATFGKAPMKEYDDKMIVEIYKSLMIGQLVPHDAAKIGAVRRRWKN